jgi:hypothetical protein
MKSIAIFIFLLLPLGYACAQYEKHPLEERQWVALMNGVNTADNISWQTTGTFSYRSDFMLTQVRLGFSQEYIEGPEDSIFFRKNRIIETGILWGEAFAKKNWYVSGSIGMGLNIRLYGDSAVQNKTDFRYLSAVTIGVPAQIETGVWIGPSFGLGTGIIANWNFRQPYVGTFFSLIYRFKKQK